jgi:hypothetical protein
MWEKTYSHSQQSLEFLLDSVASIPGGSTWIIQITARLHSGVFYSSGLILRRNIDGVYQRVGILSFAYKKISVLVLKRRWDTIRSNRKTRSWERRLSSIVFAFCLWRATRWCRWAKLKSRNWGKFWRCRGTKHCHHLSFAAGSSCRISENIISGRLSAVGFQLW